MRGEAKVNVPIDMAEKDQRLLLVTAREHGVSLTWTEAIHQRLSELQARGFGGRDVSETARWFEIAHEVSLFGQFEASPEHQERRTSEARQIAESAVSTQYE
jgi:hypothetical protein